MKKRYKLLIVALLVVFYYSILAGVITTVFFLAWCLVKASSDVNDEGMLHEHGGGEVEKSNVLVSADGEIDWEAVKF